MGFFQIPLTESWYLSAILQIVDSCICLPTICMLNGNPERLYPAGTEIGGKPL